MQCRSRPIAAMVLLVAASLPAEDWPQFRGPNGQGLSAARGLPVEWNATRNVAWKTAVPGEGWSSPVVVNDRVYLTSAISGTRGLSLRVLCLEAFDGRLARSEEHTSELQSLAYL